MPDLKLYLFLAETIWFETYDEPCTTEQEAIVSYNFDYETLFDETKRVYIDIGLKFQHAAIMFRSGIEFDGEELSWNDVFTRDFLLPIVQRAVDTTYQGFDEKCDDDKNPYNYGLEVNNKLPETIMEVMIEQYTRYRCFDDMENEFLLNNMGLECESGTDTILTLNTTFMIIDELLFYNPNFNTVQNREVFSDIIPLPRYLTLKFNCRLIEYDNVQLSFYFTILYYLCLDCALQMLVSDKADLFIGAIEAKGITKEMQNEFIKEGTSLFIQLKEILQQSNTRILNFEKRIDWDTVLR